MLQGKTDVVEPVHDAVASEFIKFKFEAEIVDSDFKIF
jgi:hypothetical protein